MTEELLILLATAASLGFVHTLIGPDHYIPFIVISKARKWSTAKTALWTFFCGLGHVLSSIIIGGVGILFGIALFSLESIESMRGDIAAWLLIGFGFLYMVWGIRQAYLNKTHKHFHYHPDGTKHEHKHDHHGEHAHLHENSENKKNITPWILFVIFVMGPCEPLIPLLMFPAAKESTFGVIMVATVFGVVTIATMMGIVLLVKAGINFLPIQKMEKYIHPLAGFTIFLSGMSMQFLGL